ncbi:MAG: hypothetical protein R3F62_18570 [Planctomycetota bacterium]
MDVDSIRSRLEDYRTALELDRYELARGLREESIARTLRSQVDELFALETRSLIESAIASAERHNLPGDVHSLKILHSGWTWKYVERELAPIDSAIDRHGRVVQIQLRDGTRQPLRDLKLLLAGADGGDYRQELESNRLQQAKLLIPLMREKIGIEQGVASSLGQPSLVALYQQETGVDLDAITALAREFLDKTNDLYQEVMGWTVRKRIGVPLADARRCDMPYVLAGRYLDYEEAFSGADMVKRTRSFLERMGIMLGANGRLKVEVDKQGPSRFYVGPIRVPQDVRLAIEIKDGQRDWQAFLDALGRALFYAHVNPEAPFEQRCLGDPSLELSYGRLFRHLLLEREWLRQSLEFNRSKDYLILAYLERLYDMRLCCGRVLYDVELRRRGTAEDMEDEFEARMREAVKVSVPRELYLHDVRTGLHSVTMLRARLFEPLLTLHLLHYFDETWWRNPRCGPFLMGLWAKGGKLRLEDMAEDMGYPLSIKPLLKLFAKNL